MKLSKNQYEQLMSDAADKLAELQTIKQELIEALEAIDNLISNYPDSTGEECAQIARAAIKRASP